MEASFLVNVKMGIVRIGIASVFLGLLLSYYSKWIDR